MEIDAIYQVRVNSKQREASDFRVQRARFSTAGTKRSNTVRWIRNVTSTVKRATMMITVDGDNDWCELNGEDEDDDMGDG